MILEPPPQYDHVLLGPVRVHELSSQEIIRACNKGPNVLACSLPPVKPGGWCIQFMPRIGPGGVGPRMWAFLKRWENARCNNWKDNNARVY